MDKWLWAVPAVFVFVIVFAPLAYYLLRDGNSERDKGQR